MLKALGKVLEKHGCRFFSRMIFLIFPNFSDITEFFSCQVQRFS